MQFIQVNPTLIKPPRNSTALYYSREINTQRHVHEGSKQVYSQYPKSGSNPNPPVDEWVNKMYICTME